MDIAVWCCLPSVMSVGWKVMVTGHVLEPARLNVPSGTYGDVFVKSADRVLAVVSVVQKVVECCPR